MPDILERIDAATDNLCMCGCGTPLNPAGPSAYYVDAAHRQAWMRAQTTRPHEVRGSEGVDPDQMRWRPDLVTDADDANLLSLGSQSWYDGRYHAQVFERTDRPGTWHLRLDDGHRYVGADLAEVGGRQDPITDELVTRIEDAWRRLERELGNTRHLVADDDPFADVMPMIGPGFPWRRMCRACNRHGQPMHGQRVVHSEHHDWLNDEVQTEICQLCPHCHEPYPGPPLTPRTRYEQPFEAWNLALSAAINGSRYRQTRVLGVPELRHSTDPAGLIRRTWDRIEVALLRQIDQGSAFGGLNHLLGIPIVADPSMPPGVAEIRNVNTGDTFRIHARDNQFTLTPAQQQEIRRRFAVMQQQANDLFVAFNEAYAPVIQQASQHAARIAGQVSAALATTNWPQAFTRDPTT